MRCAPNRPLILPRAGRTKLCRQPSLSRTDRPRRGDSLELGFADTQIILAGAGWPARGIDMLDRPGARRDAERLADHYAVRHLRGQRRAGRMVAIERDQEPAVARDCDRLAVELQRDGAGRRHAPGHAALRQGPINTERRSRRLPHSGAGRRQQRRRGGSGQSAEDQRPRYEAAEASGVA